MTLSHLSRVITRLERQGTVRRLPDPEDGRSTLAQLTAAGLNLLKEASPGHITEIRRLIFDHLDPEEQHQFGETMGKIVRALGTEGKADGAR